MSSLSLFRHAETVTFEPGSVLFQEGDPGTCMYAIAEGQVDIRKGDTLLESLGAGDVFGEMALVDKSPRSATAVAATTVRAAVVDERSFIRLVQQTPYFALEVMGMMANRLRRTNARLASSNGD